MRHQKGRVSRTVFNLALTVCAVLLGAASHAWGQKEPLRAAPSTPAPLVGTSWELGGNSVVKVQMGDKRQQTFTRSSYLLSFDPNSAAEGGNCTLDMRDGIVLPCTWTSRNAKHAIIMLESEPLRAALEQELEHRLGANIDLTLDCKPITATINPRLDRMTLKIPWKGAATSIAFRRPVHLWVTSRMTGTKISGPSPAPLRLRGTSSVIELVTRATGLIAR